MLISGLDKQPCHSIRGLVTAEIGSVHDMKWVYRVIHEEIPSVFVVNLMSAPASLGGRITFL